MKIKWRNHPGCDSGFEDELEALATLFQALTLFETFLTVLLWTAEMFIP